MIPKGPDKELEQKILTLLYEADKEAQIPWQKFIDMAQECNEIYMNEGLKYIQRNEPENELKKAWPKELTKKVQIEINYHRQHSIDPFYDPACFHIEGTKKDDYFNDFSSWYFLENILAPGFELPQQLFGKESLGHQYVLALKKAFYLLSKENNPPLPIAIKLIGFLYEIHEQAFLFQQQINQSESATGSHKKSRVNIFPQNISKLLKDPEIKKFLKTYKDTKRQRHILKEKIMDVLNIQERMAREYRKSILKKNIQKQ